MTTREEALEQALGAPINLEEWQERMRAGWLVNLNIKHWRGRKKLTFAELGIKPSTQDAQTAYDKYLKPGSKQLLPVEPIQELETIVRGARMLLEECCYETPFGTFFPRTAYKQWKWGLWKDGTATISGEDYYAKYGTWYSPDEVMFELTDGIRIAWQKPKNMVKPGNEFFRYRFQETVKEIVKNYATLIAEVRSQYAYIAEEVYWLDTTQREEVATLSDYVDHFWHKFVKPHLKSAEEFAACASYQEVFLQFAVASMLEAEEISGKRMDTVFTKQEAERAAAQEYKHELDAANRELLAKVRAQKEAMIDSFITSLVARLRHMTYEAVTSVLKSIKDNDTLQGRPVIELKGLIEQYKALNFYGDGDVDRILTTLYGIVEKPPKERNIAEIQRKLRDIGTITRSTLLALGEQPREGKEDLSPEDVGISTDPSDEEVREAREEIASGVFKVEVSEEREAREEQMTLTVLASSNGHETDREERDQAPAAKRTAKKRQKVTKTEAASAEV